MDCSSIGIALKTSGISHPDAGQVVSSARPVGKGKTIRNYYGNMAQRDLSSGGLSFKM